MTDTTSPDAHPVTWETGGPYPPEGVYRLLLSDGRVLVRPMSPDWTWDDTFNGARIDVAVLEARA